MLLEEDEPSGKKKKKKKSGSSSSKKAKSKKLKEKLNFEYEGGTSEDEKLNYPKSPNKKKKSKSR